jgi:hypothetical protein
MKHKKYIYLKIDCYLKINESCLDKALVSHEHYSDIWEKLYIVVHYNKYARNQLPF